MLELISSVRSVRKLQLLARILRFRSGPQQLLSTRPTLLEKVSGSPITRAGSRRVALTAPQWWAKAILFCYLTETSAWTSTRFKQARLVASRLLPAPLQVSGSASEEFF